MSFRKAKDNFEQALKIAEKKGDSQMEFLLEGLLELTKALRSMSGTIDNIERK